MSPLSKTIKENLLDVLTIISLIIFVIVAYIFDNTMESFGILITFSAVFILLGMFILWNEYRENRKL